MTAKVSLRDGSSLSGAMIRRSLGIWTTNLTGASGVGSGYSAGAVGTVNPTSLGTDPDHFAVAADGSTRVLSVRPGWLLAQLDSGLSSFDPQAFSVFSPDVLSATVPANATGGVRNDTIAARIDLTTAPAADGSNLLTIVCVAGASGGAMTAAPADGSLYVPLAKVAIPNGATALTQGAVTDLRSAWAGTRVTSDKHSMNRTDFGTTGVGPQEVDGALRCTVVVPSSGRVRLRGVLMAQCTTAAVADMAVWVRRYPSGSWIACPGFPFTHQNAVFPAPVSAVLTGEPGGSQAYTVGVGISGGNTLSIPAGTREAAASGSWLEASTEP